jgi:hypothetical protein
MKPLSSSFGFMIGLVWFAKSFLTTVARQLS